MRYCPVSSVVPVRTLVISAGLDASTVTPGSTAPEVSRTAPARLCAAASPGSVRRIENATSRRGKRGCMGGDYELFDRRKSTGTPVRSGHRGALLHTGVEGAARLLLTGVWPGRRLDRW